MKNEDKFKILDVPYTKKRKKKKKKLLITYPDMATPLETNSHND